MNISKSRKTDEEIRATAKIGSSERSQWCSRFLFCSFIDLALRAGDVQVADGEGAVHVEADALLYRVANLPPERFAICRTRKFAKENIFVTIYREF